MKFYGWASVAWTIPFRKTHWHPFILQKTDCPDHAICHSSYYQKRRSLLPWRTFPSTLLILDTALRKTALVLRPLTNSFRVPPLTAADHPQPRNEIVDRSLCSVTGFSPKRTLRAVYLWELQIRYSRLRLWQHQCLFKMLFLTVAFWHRRQRTVWLSACSMTAAKSSAAESARCFRIEQHRACHRPCLCGAHITKTKEAMERIKSLLQ